MSGNWIINYEFSYFYFEEGRGWVSFILFLKLIFIEVQLLCNVLVSTVQQSESAVRIHISLLFWISFPSRSPQSTASSSLSYTIFSRQLSMLCKVSTVSICQFQSLNSPHPPQPSHTHPATWWVFYLIILWLHCVFALYQGFLQLQCEGLSLQRFLLLGSTVSRYEGYSTCEVGARQSRLRLQSADSIVTAHGPSCSSACGILPDQGLNLCLLHWQADSSPMDHQRTPAVLLVKSGFELCKIQPLSQEELLLQNLKLLKVYLERGDRGRGRYELNKYLKM